MPRIAAKATKGKGKRWQKGHSSTSNPETRKHRSKAGSALSGGANNNNKAIGTNKLKLTKDLLEKFDAIQLQKQRSSNGDAECDSVAANHSQQITGSVSDWLYNSNEKSTHHDDHDEVDHNYRALDAISLGNLSAASVWSNCTNISFEKFLNGFDAKSKIHKAMLTVLATIRDAIAAQNGTESETEYFAGFMMALNCVDSEEKLTATLALIQIVLRRVPPSVLKLKFTETANAMMKIFADRVNNVQSPNGYLLKSIISILATLLRHQDRPVWEISSTQKVFRTLLSLVLHTRPRVRKAATFAVISIVSGAATECENNPQNGTYFARKLAAEFCIAQLDEHLTTTQDEHLHALLHILSLLSDTMSQFPSIEHTKKACEAILAHMTLGNVLVVNGALQTFYTFFLRRPNPTVLSAQLNAQLLNALYDYQPNINDAQPLNAWCIALKEGLRSLHHLDSKLSLSHLSKFVKIALACLASDSTAVHACVCASIKTVIDELVISSIRADNESKISDDCLRQLHAELRLALNYQFSHAWMHVIPLIGELLIDTDVALDSICPIMQRMAILRESNDAELNAVIDRTFFAKAIRLYGPSAIVKQCPIVWRVSDSTASTNTAAHRMHDFEFRGEFTNAWLLPLLRDHAHDRAELALFVDHFLPLADNLSKKAIACKKLSDRLRKQLLKQQQQQQQQIGQELDDRMETDDDESGTAALERAHESCLLTCRELERCVEAVWSLLPAFCRAPIDVDRVFAKIAQRLGATLYDCRLFHYPLAALRNLLNCDREIVTRHVAPFAKNYLTILFNLYTEEDENKRIEDGMRLPVLILAQHFVPHLFVNEQSAKMFAELFGKIRARLADPLKCGSDFQRNALLDLLGAVLASPDGLHRSDIEDLFESLAKPLIEQRKNTADQKKGFKIIEAIVKSPSRECATFVTDNLQPLIDCLYSPLIRGEGDKQNFCSPSTRAMALRAIQRLIEKINKSTANDSLDLRQFSGRLLPRILDCFLLRSVKAKKSAQNLLLLLHDWHDQMHQTESAEAMKQTIEAGNPVMAQLIESLKNRSDTDQQCSASDRAARLVALNFLYFHRYKDLASKDVQCDIADAVLAQIDSAQVSPPCRQILDVCFDFITTFLRHASADNVNQYLELITCNITSLPAEHRTKYRMRIRTLLVKLIRKFGFDFISSMVSEDYHKVLKNIRKNEERKKKQRQQDREAGNNDGDDDDDSESGIESDRKSRRSRKSKSKFADSSDEDDAEIEQFIDDDWDDRNNDDDDDDDDDEDRATRIKSSAKFDITSRLSDAKSVKSFIREDVNGDPIDLLSSSAKRNVFSAIPKQYRRAGASAESGINDSAVDESKKLSKKLPIDSDGRIVLTDLFDKIEAADKSKARRGGGGGDKRARPDDDEANDSEDDDNDNVDDEAKSVRSTVYKPGGRGIHRPVKSVSGESRRSGRSTKSKASIARSSSKRDPSSSGINRGEAFRSKNAAGDMKRRGMPDPFAYIPLNPIALNKRKSAKYRGEFKAIVKGAKKGAATGARSAARKRMKSSK